MFPLFGNQKLPNSLLYSLQKIIFKILGRAGGAFVPVGTRPFAECPHPIELDLNLCFTTFGLVGILGGCNSQQQWLFVAAKLN